jgi:hypothetical protein
VRIGGLRAALVGAVSLLAACSEPNALLLTVTAERQVQSFDFTVRDLAAMQNVAETIGQALPADQDISQQGQELKLAVRFLAPGTYLVHIVGRDATGVQVGSRAYRVEGTVEARLQLAAVPAGGDQDGDGFPSQAACAAMAAEGVDCTYADCDDNLPRVNPLATERCNGRDDDCDGKLREDETDEDGDGFLHCDDCNPNDETDFDSTKYVDCRDCNDQRADIHPASRRDPAGYPAAAEDCTNCKDQLDYNCDGVINPCNDLDCDGWPGCGLEGAPAKPLCDCNDDNRTINPGVTDTCGDKIDNNCDGQTDEGCMPCDVDGDLFMRNDPLNGCNPDANQADCDDTDSGIFPGAAATCNDKQGGCRDMALRGNCWRDALGQITIVDCKLRDAGNAPKCQATDLACQTRTGCPSPTCDADGDGFMRNDPANGCNPPAGLEDCDDNDPHTFPGAPDRCGDGKKQNCSYDSPCTDDADGDGYNSSEDCDDNDPAVHPWAVDVCNGKDDDCDGITDEGNPDSSPTGATVAGTTCTDNDLGECSKKQGACICSKLVPVGTRNESYRHGCRTEDLGAVASPRCFGAGQPQLETAQTCDGLDQDCDGVGDDVAGEVPCATGTACKWVTSVWKCACDAATACDGCCVISSPADSCIYLAGESVGQCGVGGEMCHTCNDSNVCTTDTCDVGVCHHTNFPDHQGCPGGQCRVPGSGGAAQCCSACWLGENCAASSVTACGTGGVDCVAVNTSCGLCAACDGAGGCGYVPAGQDTNDQCATQPACGQTGLCAGNGTCALYPNGTSCGTCRTCNGTGTCGNVAAGSDLNNECNDESGCGHDGWCNNNGTCRYYPATKSCGLCSMCNGTGACSVMPTDDANCGTIDCDTLDVTCRNYNDITSARCKTLGTCKTSADCTFTANTGTRCEQPTPCKACDSAGNCAATPGDDPLCGTIDCDGLDVTCRNYNDITASRCASLGVCKPPNQSGTCTDYVNAGSGTVCTTCKTCDAGGGCTVNVAPGGGSSGACTDQTAATCGTNGLCDGGGLCQYYSTGTRCATCTTCASAHTCTTPVANGSDPVPDCAACMVCNGAGGCRPVTAGQDTKGNCAATPQSTCGNDGNCDGNGACAKWGPTTKCATCKLCNGTGACDFVPAGTPSLDCPAQTADTCGRTGDCAGDGTCALWPVGTTCGTCHVCDGLGACVHSPANQIGPGCTAGNEKCCNGNCCGPPTQNCLDGGTCG